jgi:hypothetical protein
MDIIENGKYTGLELGTLVYVHVCWENSKKNERVE